jgi:hypothetical protein
MYHGFPRRWSNASQREAARKPRLATSLSRFGEALLLFSLGLQAIAQEWSARLRAISLLTDLTTSTLINGGASWKYNDTGQDLGSNWKEANFYAPVMLCCR